MSILFLAHRLPYPPDRGDRIRSWHVLQAIAKLDQVHVVAPIEDESERRWLPEVGAVAASVTVAKRSTSKLGAMFGALTTGLPASVIAFQHVGLKQKVRELIAAHSIETIYAFSGQMAGYVPPDFTGRFVMDFVDMDSAKFLAIGGFANRQEAKRLKAWEIDAARRAHVSLFVSDAEADLFTRETGCGASVLGNGIDLERFAPDVIYPIEPSTPLIVFTGQMDYEPNIEAVTDFVRKTLPAIHATVPHARFAIVGRAPTAAVRALASDHVVVTGEVDDTRPWLAGADVIVAPLKLARGVQNKVLEAMAMGRAVVLSSGAAQGIDAEDGRDFIVADEPAQAVIALLRDAGRRLAIGGAARTRMVEHYAWDAQMRPLAGYLGLSS